MEKEDLDSLYRFIHNAGFWRKCGFRNKRASHEVERRERRYMEEYIGNVEGTIVEMRINVTEYITRCYSEVIRESSFCAVAKAICGE